MFSAEEKIKRRENKILETEAFTDAENHSLN